MRYIDRVGDLPVGERHDGYCVTCKSQQTSKITVRSRKNSTRPKYLDTIAAALQVLSKDEYDYVINAAGRV